MNIKINENYDNLKESYLFSETARRINKYTAEHPDKKVIKLSIGDVTLPLTKTVIELCTKLLTKWQIRILSEDIRPNTDMTF